jgi:hypothetical protein
VIVLKAKTRPEVAALAVQLRYYAEFGEPFNNRYEDGYAIKGQVRAVPLPDADGIAAVVARVAGARQETFVGDAPLFVGAADVETLLAALRDQAAQIGRLEQQIGRLEGERDMARGSAAQAHQLLQLLSPGEHLQLIDRNIMREHPDLWQGDAIAADEHSPARRAFTAQVLELAATRIEMDGPDDVHVSLRAAEHCAAIVRGLKTTKKEEPTP